MENQLQQLLEYMKVRESEGLPLSNIHTLTMVVKMSKEISAYNEEI